LTLVAVFVALVFFYSLISRRLERTILTAPIVFTTAGIASFLILPAPHHREGAFPIFLGLAEAGLVLILFADSSRTDLGVLKSIRSLPTRLLSTGMLLTLLLGGVAALVVYPGLSVWDAGILSAILAPTDAGLGQVIVNSPRVPKAIREALNVEAGLNDGLSVPFLLFFMALASPASPGEHPRLARFIVEQLGFGAILGIAVGLIGGWLLGRAHSGKWSTESLERIGLVALPVACLIAAAPIGTSAFIAAFVAGLAVQVGFPDAGKLAISFTEDLGQVLSFAVFFLFGMLVARDHRQFTPASALYAVSSLTIVRMLPVAIALAGTGLSRATVLFMGWFGPRGLASIVLGLVYLEHTGNPPGAAWIRPAVMLTVLASIFAHGLTALPGIRLYSHRVAALEANAPELRD
jgi:sodium/hydrogen antiporter